jgi:hypothetical protein
MDIEGFIVFEQKVFFSEKKDRRKTTIVLVVALASGVHNSGTCTCRVVPA